MHERRCARSSDPAPEDARLDECTTWPLAAVPAAELGSFHLGCRGTVGPQAFKVTAREHVSPSCATRRIVSVERGGVSRTYEADIGNDWVAAAVQDVLAGIYGR